MNIHLLQRLQLLLQLVKDDRLCVTARENLAAAKELVDTAHVLGDIDHTEYRNLRSLCTHAHIEVSNSELDRAYAALPNVHDCAKGRMHDAPRKIVTTMPGGYIA